MRDTSNCHRVHWLNELKKNGLKPIPLIIEEINGDWPWQESEKHWISFFKRHGHNLTNNTIGGDGVVGISDESKKRMSSTWIGRKHKPETIEKLKKCRPNYKASDETKKKQSKALSGRKILWADKISKNVRKLTDYDVHKILEKLNKGALVCNLAKEYQVHRTTISKVKNGTYNNRTRKK